MKKNNLLILSGIFLIFGSAGVFAETNYGISSSTTPVVVANPVGWSPKGSGGLCEAMWSYARRSHQLSIFNNCYPDPAGTIKVSVKNGTVKKCYELDKASLTAKYVKSLNYCTNASNNYLLRTISNVSMSGTTITLTIKHVINAPGYKPAGNATVTWSETLTPQKY